MEWTEAIALVGSLLIVFGIPGALFWRKMSIESKCDHPDWITIMDPFNPKGMPTGFRCRKCGAKR